MRDMKDKDVPRKNLNFLAEEFGWMEVPVIEMGDIEDKTNVIVGRDHKLNFENIFKHL